MKRGLHLAADDSEGLEILSARLQDAVGKLKDFVYLPKKRRFAALLNRFQWEEKSPRRVRAGLHFDGVLAVQSRNVKLGAGEGVVALLAIRYTPKGEEDMAGVIELVLAGGGTIRLTVECIDAGLADLGGGWPARARPAHQMERG